MRFPFTTFYRRGAMHANRLHVTCLIVLCTLAPGLAPRLVGDAEAPSALHVSSRAGRELEIGLPLSESGGDAIRWHLETADFFPEFGLRQQRYRLVGESARFDDGVWRFRVR